MADHRAPDIDDLAPLDHLLTTTKQVRKRMDFTRPVPRDLILDCIDLAQHAPMGGNLQRNRWMIVDDRELIERIAVVYERVGRPYLAASEDGPMDDTGRRIVDSARFLVDHLAEVPALVLPMRLDRVAAEADTGSLAAHWGSVVPGVWSFQLAARARGLGSAWTTFTLHHEDEVGEMLGIPDTVTQVALLPVAFYTGETFQPAARRPAREITYANQWKAPVG
ncbi:MAG: nitroreductase family protein [Actinomycetota bacterium]